MITLYIEFKVRSIESLYFMMEYLKEEGLNPFMVLTDVFDDSIKTILCENFLSSTEHFDKTLIKLITGVDLTTIYKMDRSAHA